MSETDASAVMDKKAYSHRLQPTAYRLRCIKATNGVSGTNNKKATLVLEIFDAKPQKYRGQDGVEGDEIDINGLQIYSTLSFAPKAIEPFANPALRAFGVPPVNEGSVGAFDSSILVGRTVAAICETELTEKKNNVTGETITNPNTGKPVMDFRRVVKEYLPLE